MAKITVIDTDHASLFYYPDKKIIHHIFHRPISGQPFRNVVNAGVELLREHGATKWLSDDRANEPFPQEDTDWTMDDWLPRAVAAGWRYWALIVPENIYARMNMSEYVETFYDRGVRIMVFTDPDKARQWLEQQ
jgi:hypothetical protein